MILRRYAIKTTALLRVENSIGRKTASDNTVFDKSGAVLE